MGLRSSSRAAGIVAALLVAGVVANGCGKGGGGSSGASSGAPAGGGGASGGGVAAVSPYDSGPRAGEQPIDESLVKKGEALFQAKGCSACHGFGRRISCPDLNGVTMRRTAQWMEHQILHPEVMTKQDPIAHQLFAQYSLQMPNQGLTADEAHAVIEFLKHKNHETAEGAK
ncbi:MAG TPA: cytochrome c [Candidatus Eisenbacteria bacterium]